MSAKRVNELAGQVLLHAQVGTRILVIVSLHGPYQLRTLPRTTLALSESFYFPYRFLSNPVAFYTNVSMGSFNILLSFHRCPFLFLFFSVDFFSPFLN